MNPAFIKIKNVKNKLYTRFTNNGRETTKTRSSLSDHDVNIQDFKTLVDAITLAHSVRTTPIHTISADRGYIGGQQYVQVELITPKKPLKIGSESEKNR